MTLALEYRPRVLKEVVGNENAVSVIRGMLKSRKIPNGIMLSGPLGCGKTTLARVIYNHLKCEKFSACGKCAGCLSEDDSDLIEINAGDKRGIDEARSLIDQLKFKPRVAARRVFLIDEIQEATPQALAALLKPTEEPPAHVLFIFCTTDPQKIKPTLRSRFLQLQVAKPTYDESELFFLRILEKSGNSIYTQEILKSVYEHSNSMRECLQVLEVLNSASANGEISKDKAMSLIAGSSATEEGNATSLNILKAIYEGNFPEVHRELLRNDDYFSLLNNLVWINGYAVDVTIMKNEKNKNIAFWSTVNQEFFAFVKKQKPSLEQLIQVQAGIVELRVAIGSVVGLGDRYILSSRLYTLMNNAKLME